MDERNNFTLDIVLSLDTILNFFVKIVTHFVQGPGFIFKMNCSFVEDKFTCFRLDETHARITFDSHCGDKNWFKICTHQEILALRL